MLLELRSLEWLDISGHLDGDIITKLAVIKAVQVHVNTVNMLAWLCGNTISQPFI